MESTKIQEEIHKVYEAHYGNTLILSKEEKEKIVTLIKPVNIDVGSVSKSVCKYKNCNKPTDNKDFDNNYCLYHYDQIN